MTKRNIRIRELRRDEIDLQKLAHALLRLARDRLADVEPKGSPPEASEPDNE